MADQRLHRTCKLLHQAFLMDLFPVTKSMKGEKNNTYVHRDPSPKLETGLNIITGIIQKA